MEKVLEICKKFGPYAGTVACILLLFAKFLNIINLIYTYVEAYRYDGFSFTMSLFENLIWCVAYIGLAVFCMSFAQPLKK